MKIKSVRIQNFRGFIDETISFDDCTCLVGPNGAGKSTILSALNVFFQEAGGATDVTTLTAEDFHGGNTAVPIEITVTFDQISEAAKQDLTHYVRHGELVVTSVATFDAQLSRAPVVQLGERLVFKQFAPFFEDEKNKATVEPLRERFSQVVTHTHSRMRGTGALSASTSSETSLRRPARARVTWQPNHSDNA